MQQDSWFIWYVGLLAAGDGLFPCDKGKWLLRWLAPFPFLCNAFLFFGSAIAALVLDWHIQVSSDFDVDT